MRKREVLKCIPEYDWERTHNAYKSEFLSQCNLVQRKNGEWWNQWRTNKLKYCNYHRPSLLCNILQCILTSQVPTVFNKVTYTNNFPHILCDMWKIPLLRLIDKIVFSAQTMTQNSIYLKILGISLHLIN